MPHPSGFEYAIYCNGIHLVSTKAHPLPAATSTGLTPYVIDEFGIAMVLAGLALAFVFWRKRSELPVNAATPPQGIVSSDVKPRTV